MPDDELPKNKANSNPIPQGPKMNLSSSATSEYVQFSSLKSPKTNPILERLKNERNAPPYNRLRKIYPARRLQNQTRTNPIQSQTAG
jgi:hypothetical protein